MLQQILGTTTPSSAAGDGRSTAQILAAVREDTEVLDGREIDRLKNVVAWANRNTVVSVDVGAATIRDSYIDTGIPIAGDGAPLVTSSVRSPHCWSAASAIRSRVGMIGSG